MTRHGTRDAIRALMLAALLLVGPGLATRAHAQFPYQAFDAMEHTDIKVPGGVLRVGFGPGEFALGREKVLAWIERSAKSVSVYYGRFPVPSARILIIPSAGSGIQRGQTWGYRGGAIRVVLGRDSSEDDLARDWVMVHEMVHLALPDMDTRHNWLSEGLAVYVEPIARAQADDLPERSVWYSFVRGMPQGLPEIGDQGFDNTPTWGRTYWGGALFCLLADIEIRKRTGNRLGLQDAMRGLLAAGGTHEEFWPIRRVLAAADAATGVPVLGELYDQMRDRAVTPDLKKLWDELGLKPAQGGVQLDQTAPLAAIRDAITAAPRR